MLFRKFVFVLYVLFCDAWFLLGSYYGTSYRFVPLVSMFASLSSICVITLFQLQAMFARERLTDDEKWSTVLWSCLHMFISLLFFVDGLEWANLFVVFCMAGLTMTLVIFIVGTCSCHVIIHNGKTWYPHVHLTCVAFWTLIQFMALRTPAQVVTTVPIACMALTRLIEHADYKTLTNKETVGEFILWFVCIVVHILRDVGSVGPQAFYWGGAVVIFILCLCSSHAHKLFLVVILPLLVLPFCIYIAAVRCMRGNTKEALQHIARLYEDVVRHDEDLMVLPFEEGMDESDWDQPL